MGNFCKEWWPTGSLSVRCCVLVGQMKTAILEIRGMICCLTTASNFVRIHSNSIRF